MIKSEQLIMALIILIMISIRTIMYLKSTHKMASGDRAFNNKEDKDKMMAINYCIFIVIVVLAVYTTITQLIPAIKMIFQS